MQKVKVARRFCKVHLYNGQGMLRDMAFIKSDEHFVSDMMSQLKCDSRRGVEAEHSGHQWKACS